MGGSNFNETDVTMSERDQLPKFATDKWPFYNHFQSVRFVRMS